MVRKCYCFHTELLFFIFGHFNLIIKYIYYQICLACQIVQLNKMIRQNYRELNCIVRNTYILKTVIMVLPLETLGKAIHFKGSLEDTTAINQVCFRCAHSAIST